MKRLMPIVLFVFPMLINGCSTYDMWIDDRNEMIGTKFDPLSKNNRNKAGIAYRDSIYEGEENIYCKIEQEQPNTRYYIPWNYNCRYSLLVAPDNTILSWRLGGSCSIFQ